MRTAGWATLGSAILVLTDTWFDVTAPEKTADLLVLRLGLKCIHGELTKLGVTVVRAEVAVLRHQAGGLEPGAAGRLGGLSSTRD
jgi:hypothetical protein